MASLHARTDWCTSLTATIMLHMPFRTCAGCHGWDVHAKFGEPCVVWEMRRVSGGQVWGIAGSAGPFGALHLKGPNPTQGPSPCILTNAAGASCVSFACRPWPNPQHKLVPAVKVRWINRIPAGMLASSLPSVSGSPPQASDMMHGSTRSCPLQDGLHAIVVQKGLPRSHGAGPSIDIDPLNPPPHAHELAGMWFWFTLDQ